MYLICKLLDVPRIHLVDQPYFSLSFSVRAWLALEALGFIFPPWNLEQFSSSRFFSLGRDGEQEQSFALLAFDRLGM